MLVTAVLLASWGLQAVSALTEGKLGGDHANLQSMSEANPHAESVSRAPFLSLPVITWEL